MSLSLIHCSWLQWLKTVWYRLIIRRLISYEISLILNVGGNSARNFLYSILGDFRIVIISYPPTPAMSRGARQRKSVVPGFGRQPNGSTMFSKGFRKRPQQLRPGRGRAMWKAARVLWRGRLLQKVTSGIGILQADPLWNWQLHAVLLWRASCLDPTGFRKWRRALAWHSAARDPSKLAAPCCFAVAGRLFGRWRRGSRACFPQASESGIRHRHSAAQDLLKPAAPCCIAVASQLFGRWRPELLF